MSHPADERGMSLILLGDSDEKRRNRFMNLFRANNLRVIDAADSIDLISKIDSTEPSAIIISLSIEKMAPLSVVEIIRDKPWHKYTPIFILGEGDDPIPEGCFEMGVTDFLRGEIPTSELLARIHNAMKLSREFRYLDTRLDSIDKELRRREHLPDTRIQEAGQPVEREMLEGEIPPLPKIIGRIKEALEFFDELWVIYINVEGVDLIEKRYGWRQTGTIIKEISNILSNLCDLSLQKRYGKVFVSRHLAEDFLLFVSKGGANGKDENILFLQGEVESELTQGTINRIGKDLAALLHFSFGKSQLQRVPDVNLERNIYRAVKEANINAGALFQSEVKKKEISLRHCLERELFHVLYQPILSVRSGGVEGFEVLTRCRMEALQNPQILFDVAERAGLVWDVSRIIRRLAFVPFDELKEREYIFINLHPLDLKDPKFMLTEIWEEMMEKVSERLVFEITERSAMKKVENFRDLLYPFRRLGYGFAVDDLGSGYAGLNVISLLEPDFIKFDMNLVRDVHKYQVKRNLIKAMVRFSDEIGCKTIAEGVEKVEEAKCLIETGCHYLQGFLFAPASPPFIRMTIREVMRGK